MSTNIDRKLLSTSKLCSISSSVRKIGYWNNNNIPTNVTTTTYNEYDMNRKSDQHFLLKTYTHSQDLFWHYHLYSKFNIHPVHFDDCRANKVKQVTKLMRKNKIKFLIQVTTMKLRKMK
ncbi:hypothetical protein EWB00_008430 [Schistosoma japonicum]|uniref:Uncharacterized protein n=1 Tax=Schistosoma japonicum TaxID=6182 RepID=A0A4Z2CQH6_SCHJA|nr:hypothetical protein EWB00_008430 [Schistosoma japonicum]